MLRLWSQLFQTDCGLCVSRCVVWPTLHPLSSPSSIVHRPLSFQFGFAQNCIDSDLVIQYFSWQVATRSGQTPRKLLCNLFSSFIKFASHDMHMCKLTLKAVGVLITIFDILPESSVFLPCPLES